MAKRSKFDRLHDKYDELLTGKAGTRYERLTAIVFKILEERNVVIHDVSLLGESDVAHQIDVRIFDSGRERHILIECKDFDVAGSKVGLEVVRNFWAVVHDTAAEEAIIITCNGFTRPAAKFAKAKNIKLAILREFQDADWEGRIKTAVVRLLVQSEANYKLGIDADDEATGNQFVKAFSSLSIAGRAYPADAYVVKEDERIALTEFLRARLEDAVQVEGNPGRMKAIIQSDGWEVVVGDTGPLAFMKMTLEFDVRHNLAEFAVTSERVAELILQGFGDDDLIIFGDQIERRRIDAQTGAVV